MRDYDDTELRSLDVAYHLPAQQDWGQQARSGGSRLMVTGEGSTIVDAEGNRFLDAMAGLWRVQVGYGRDEPARVAFEQMRELPDSPAPTSASAGVRDGRVQCGATPASPAA